MDRFMTLAFSLAKKSDPFPNPRVGAVLVNDGKIIGRGYHHGPGNAHAEIVAIEDAKKKYGPDSVCGSTLYVSLEPCSHSHVFKRTPPCTKTIIHEGIARVVYAMKDPNPYVRGNGERELRANGIEVLGPTDPNEAKALNKRYVAWIKKPPSVSIKMAMSVDGKSATRTGDSRWISSPESLGYVHRLRGECDAIMVGAGTVKTDDPILTTHGLGRDPFRIIIDGRLSIPLASNVLANPDDKTVVVASEDAPKNKRAKIPRLIICGKNGQVDLNRLVRMLGGMGIKKILIEGGSELNAKALEAGIVDQILIFVAPKIIGGRNALPVIGGEGIGKMAQALALGKMKIKRIGPDLLIEAKIKKK